MLLRCDMSGAYLTRDGGRSWRMLNFPGGAQAFAFDPLEPARLYVGATGLHVSDDGGANWRLLFPDPGQVTGVRHLGDHAAVTYLSQDNFPNEPVVVRTILVDPQRSEHLLIGLGRWVYASEDAGKTWHRLLEFSEPVLRIVPEGPPGRFLAFTRRSATGIAPEGTGPERPLPDLLVPLDCVDVAKPSPDGNVELWALRAGSRGGRPAAVLRREAGSDTWQEVTPPPAPNAPRPGSYSHIAAAPSSPGTAYLVCDAEWETRPGREPGLWYGVLRTDDGGRNWRWVYRAGGGSADYTIRDGREADNLRDGWVHEAFSGEFIAVLHVGVDPRDADHAVFTDWYRAMQTTDGGGIWEALYSETLPGGSARSRGLDVTTSYGVHFDPFDPLHIAVSYTDIAYFHSHDGGGTWRRSAAGVPPAWDNTCYWIQFDPARRGRLWSAWSSRHDLPKLKMIRDPDWLEKTTGGVCVSDDGGNSWQVSSEGLPANAAVTSLLLDPASPPDRRRLWAAVFGHGVYRSTDDGRTWQQASQGLGDNRHAWELTMGADGTVYLVTTHATRFEGRTVLPDLLDGAVYRSADGGDHWVRLPLPPGVRFPSSLAPDPGRPERLWLAAWGGMTRGEFGASQDPQTLLESKGGVWRSEDGGQTWRQTLSDEAYVYSVSVDPRHPGRIYCNTFHREAWRSDDWGDTWKRIEGYDFRWGHRVIPDPHDPERVYITTFGGSVFHGRP